MLKYGFAHYGAMDTINLFHCKVFWNIPKITSEIYTMKGRPFTLKQITLTAAKQENYFD